MKQSTTRAIKRQLYLIGAITVFFFIFWTWGYFSIPDGTYERKLLIDITRYIFPIVAIPLYVLANIILFIWDARKNKKKIKEL